MTLEEAIDHLQESLNNKEWDCQECRQEHEQLLEWLIELEQFRNFLKKDKLLDNLDDYWERVNTSLDGEYSPFINDFYSFFSLNKNYIQPQFVHKQGIYEQHHSNKDLFLCNIGYK